MSAFSKETLHMKTITALIAGLLLSLMATAVLANDNFRTHCKGGNEVPPVDTGGQCQTIFNLTEDGTGLQYKLIVANLEFVTQAHIHLAPAGQNGGVVAFLFGFEPGGVTVNGILSQGVLTDGDLVGELSGMTIADLVAELETGDAYVNVHTQTVPSGEVRGQVD
jgi:hypothetical protein